jgi:NAD(P)H-flavin reductase/ferredoxin
VQHLSRDALARIIATLRASGKTVIGPTARDHAIVLDEIESFDDLPLGWTDSQGPGRYRLTRDGDRVFEGYVVGPSSLKTSRFPSSEVLYRAERRADGKLGFSAATTEAPPTAVLGVRACDLAAAKIQERTLEGGPYADPRHRARRQAQFLIAVNCTEPGELCFCTSTDTGPRVKGGADLVLTERGDGFLVEAGSDDGRALLADLGLEDASDDDARWVDEALSDAATRMGRAMDLEDLPGLLFARLDHPRWAEVADRCLACGNCTSVCPTCFCSTTEEPSSLDGSSASHVRLWESCFSVEHAAIHGAQFRPTVKDRYRQWLTHKVGGWVSQIGTSGCVGCGRCIAWCPVGIDLTEEIAALREGAGEPAWMPEAPTHASPRDDDGVPIPAEVIAITHETADTVTLHVNATRVDPQGMAGFLPGRFCQLSLPGIGEVPISISGHDGAAVEHTIRAVGAVTAALCALEPGDELGLRGPYGRPWPLDTLAHAPVVVIAGGIGLAPLRGALREMLGRPEEFPEVHLVYGARSPDDALYVREMLGWLEEPGFSLHLTVDHAPPSWRGNIGVVTRLLHRGTVPENASAMICGPEVMMRYAALALTKLGLPDERIWVTMERHMSCATGFCGRCQMGPYFVCKDGPVFRLDELVPALEQEGF